MSIWNELKAFRDWLLLHEMPSSAISLWYGLFTTWNMAGCQSKFSAPNSTLQKLTGLSKQGLMDARNTLINQEFIRYEKGKKGIAPKYELLSLVHPVDSYVEQSDTQSQTHPPTQDLPLIEELKERRSSRSIEPEDLFIVYEQNFGDMRPLLKNELRDWCEAMGEDLVYHAIILAVKQGGNTFSYVEKTLIRWQEAGVKTLEDVRNYIKQHKKQKRAVSKKQTKQESLFDRLRREGNTV